MGIWSRLVTPRPLAALADRLDLDVRNGAAQGLLGRVFVDCRMPLTGGVLVRIAGRLRDVRIRLGRGGGTGDPAFDACFAVDADIVLGRTVFSDRIRRGWLALADTEPAQLTYDDATLTMSWPKFDVDRLATAITTGVAVVESMAADAVSPERLGQVFDEATIPAIRELIGAKIFQYHWKTETAARVARELLDASPAVRALAAFRAGERALAITTARALFRDALDGGPLAEAALIAERVRVPETIDLVFIALGRGPGDRHRRDLLDAVGRLGDASHVPALKELGDDPDVRLTIAKIKVRLGGNAKLGALAVADAGGELSEPLGSAGAVSVAED